MLKCPSCDTEIQGEFGLNRFSRLSDDQLLFLEVFIKLRGNLKDVGAEFGISYPTARGKLDSLIGALGFEETGNLTSRRLEILNQLKEGLLTTEEALERLQGGN
jgi:hypothetical protein